MALRDRSTAPGTGATGGPGSGRHHHGLGQGTADGPQCRHRGPSAVPMIAVLLLVILGVWGPNSGDGTYDPARGTPERRRRGAMRGGCGARGTR